METQVFLAALLALLCSEANGEFRLFNVYQNEMVLQMEPKSAVLAGFSDFGARVSVTYEGNSIETPVDVDGTWKIVLPPHAQGGPVDFNLSQNGNETVSLLAWFGDVWFCSGQSNMEMPVREVFNATEEIEKALGYQNLRLLQIKNNYSLNSELVEVDGFSIPWSAPTSELAASFSALCLFFGERISNHFGNTRPIGLIDSSWSGTRIEAWSSPRVMEYCGTPANDGEFENSESALWNGMVAPLTKTAIRGAIWYQGSTNVEWNSAYYSCHIQTLVKDWRDTFQQGNVPADENAVAFPFGVFQNGPTEQGDDFRWGYLRVHQTADQGVLPNVLIPEAFVGNTYDLTDHDSPTGDIHFRDKQTATTRLANAAKNVIYGQTNFRKYGPVPKSAEFVSPGALAVNYDVDIRIAGLDGFHFQRGNGSWSGASFQQENSTAVVVQVDLDATLLTYAFRSSVCEYKQCAIYSADEQDLPAQPWLFVLPAFYDN
ncbi:sialate O-acetylesterase-like [Neocloeon triangulifer]|uniref:sialate O-acetylesterase-like n=1 Tax=Neocloeon triangulifer TaxID=2078957 RepID=UPI00286F3469|nr:sialate O-acetylesterase-like [Neocloeon triangulifer]